jgi:hypothetical protein
MPEPDPPPPWEELPYITEHINNAYEDNTLHPAYIDQCPTQTLQELPQTASSTMITDGNGYPTENTEHPTIMTLQPGDHSITKQTMCLLKQGNMHINFPTTPI